MIFDFIISFIFGLACHQTKRITRNFPNGWENVADDSIGGVMLIVGTPYWYHRLGMAHGWRRVVVAGCLAALGIGAGVVAGWVMDGDK